jgi:hypothetical protein
MLDGSWRPFTKTCGGWPAGVRLDETLGKNDVVFKDPDRIAREFYMA